MDARAGWSTPLLHVTEVERSIRFYRQLGFEVLDVEDTGDGKVAWTRMGVPDGSAIMLLRLDPGIAVVPDQQGIMLVLYTARLPDLRAQLLAAGETPGEIKHFDWMPSGTLLLRDPDGYSVAVHQWGDTEHTAWLAAIERKRAEGRIP